MGSTIDHPHCIVEQAIMQKPDALIETSILLWERLALELTAIIGEEGFISLYARSVTLNSVAFPWLVQLPDQASEPSESRFTGLHSMLKKQQLINQTETTQACKKLLITFVDILTLLIGARITSSILGSACLSMKNDTGTHKNTQTDEQNDMNNYNKQIHSKRTEHKNRHSNSHSNNQNNQNNQNN